MSDDKQKEDALAPAPPKAAITTGRVVPGGLIPEDFDQLFRLARVMSASGMMPKGCERPEQVFVAVQMGLEVGLSPMQSVQNIAVINGRPTIWGDAAIALVRASGLSETIVETPLRDSKGVISGYTCFSKRTDGDTAEHSFTINDAKTANLWGKSGPWKTTPFRMLQMRARAFVLRDLYPDVLKGLHFAEEMQDVHEPAPPTETAADALKARLAAAVDTVDAEVVEPDEPAQTEPEGPELSLEPEPVEPEPVEPEPVEPEPEDDGKEWFDE